MSLQPNFEYKVENLDDEDLDNLEAKLNALGLEGWELTNVDQDNVAIFKRKQLYITEPYTGSERHRSRPPRQIPPN